MTAAHLDSQVCIWCRQWERNAMQYSQQRGAEAARADGGGGEALARGAGAQAEGGRGALQLAGALGARAALGHQRGRHDRHGVPPPDPRSCSFSFCFSICSRLASRSYLLLDVVLCARLNYMICASKQL